MDKLNEIGNVIFMRTGYVFRIVVNFLNPEI
jgi:hypothetical protein